MQCHVKVGKGGRLTIPATYRRALDLKIGDKLILQLNDDVLRLFRQLHALQKIQSLAKSKSKQKNHTDHFIVFRKKDERV